MYKINNNGEIDFFRFIFAVIIMIYHFSHSQSVVPGGYIGVEYFFVVSGYLLVPSIINKKNNEVGFSYNMISCFAHKFIPIYIWYWGAELINFTIRMIFEKWSLKDVMKILFMCIPNFTLTGMLLQLMEVYGLQGVGIYRL